MVTRVPKNNENTHPPFPKKEGGDDFRLRRSQFFFVAKSEQEERNESRLFFGVMSSLKDDGGWGLFFVVFPRKKKKRMIRREKLSPNDQNHVTQCLYSKVSGLSARPEWERERRFVIQGTAETGPLDRSTILSPSRGQSNISLGSGRGGVILLVF